MQPIEVLPVDLESLTIKLNQILGKTAIYLIGDCTATFDGRIKSTLQQGARFLLIKSDTSIILHGDTSVKPLNWQKAYDGHIKFRYTDNKLEMYTYRPKTDETFIILFTSMFHAFSFNSRDSSTLEMVGDERDLVNYLVTNPEVIEYGITIASREKETLVGFSQLA